MLMERIILYWLFYSFTPLIICYFDGGFEAKRKNRLNRVRLLGGKIS